MTYWTSIWRKIKWTKKGRKMGINNVVLVKTSCHVFKGVNVLNYKTEVLTHHIWPLFVSSAEERRKNQILCVIIVSGQRKISGQLEPKATVIILISPLKGYNAQVEFMNKVKGLGTRPDWKFIWSKVFVETFKLRCLTLLNIKTWTHAKNISLLMPFSINYILCNHSGNNNRYTPRQSGFGDGVMERTH